MIFKNAIASALFTLAFVNITEANYGLAPVTTGINSQTGARPFRRNILDLQNDAPAWSLYIQALIAMQATPEDELLSYFQIAGIHGRPYYSWDGYEWNPDAPLIGYCTHHNTLFPTWHRPYLALFERVLADQAQKIAKGYNIPLYQSAADNLRMPYWDWAETPRLPEVVTTPNITIVVPSGQITIKNPLYEYQFLNFPLNETMFPADKDARLSTYSATVRQPTNDGLSQNSAASDDLARKPLRKNIYDVYAKVNDYNTMSTGGTAGLSFEYPHGLVHTSVGGGSGFFDAGHMSSVAYSAFDPIFWLHHTNVDRYFALWESINPTSFLTPSEDTSGTFTHPTGINITVSDALTPFTMSDGATPYTSTSSRYLKDFGHSYPEIQDWLPEMTPDALKKNVTAWINTHYNPTATSRKLKRMNKPGREWVIAISAVGTAFGIEEKYVVELAVNGTKFGALFVSPPVAADAEGKSLDSTTNSEIDLSDVVADNGIDVEDSITVTAFLKSALECSARTVNAISIPGPQTPGLEITVYDVLVMPPADITEFPHYGRKTVHPDITKDKAGSHLGISG